MTEIGIIAVGGYNEMGRNMTGIRIDNDIIVLDMGLQLDRVQIHEDVEIDKMHSMDLIKMGAIPDDTVMKEVSGSVKAIVCTHGHLDHIGAIPKLAHRYKAPIIATPYTAELVRHEISEEKKFKVNNEVIPLKIGGRYNLTPDIQIEFIRIQHSIVDSAFAAIHTPDGVVLYASDFKLDRTPTLGDAPDFQRLRKLGKEGVKAMITESTNSGFSGKTPSERIAKDLVRDVLLGTEETESGILITTFSSHVARISAIIEAAEEMDRIPVLLGRSMERYLSIAHKMGYIKFPNNLEIHGNRNAVEKALKRISQDGKKKYLPIITGHQGEPESILTRIANGETQFRIDPGDKVIFSANTIPSPMTMANRHALEIKLKMAGARIYENVHVSGHASKEDHWELLRMIAPEQVIPSHGFMTMHANYVEMAEEAGYVFGDTVHIMRNGEEMVL
ncbi:MAG: RNase J family beta-CASP ribonuclease [Candidatus Methanoperedens sp.]|nr:RNase J family beta-CASP ribonuclease [Candidatus Methanoperedens sp.]